MSTDADIRAGLAALAERVGPPSSDGDDLARLVVREETARRRRHRGMLAVAASVALIVTAVPIALDRAGSEPGDVATPTLRPADILTLPTRGSLAGDMHFVETIRIRPWSRTSGVPTPPPETRRVVYAGEVAGASVALVVGENTAADPAADADTASRLAGVWFVDGEAASAPHGVAEDSPTAFVDGRGNLIVVAAPGDTVEVSQRPALAADGSRSRAWETAETRDGVAVFALDGPAAEGVSSVPRDHAVSYRVLRDGVLVERSTPDHAWDVTRAIGLRMGSVRDVPHLGWVVAQDSATRVLMQLGLTDLDADVDVQWAGPVPGADDATAALVTVTVPSGAVVVGADVEVGAPGGPRTGASCGLEVRPAGAPAEDRVYATACPIPGSPDLAEALVVVAPQEVVAVRVYDGDGEFLAEFPASDGVAAVPLPRGAAEVEAVKGGGVLFGRSDLLAQEAFLGE